MSAWIVSKHHITTLVDGAIVLGLIDPKDATKVGRMLTNANKRSIRARYGRWDDEAANVETYNYPYGRDPQPGNLGHVYMQSRCYGYQTCEYDGYERSVAGRFIERLERAIRKECGNLTHDEMWYLPETQEAPWGV